MILPTASAAAAKISVRQIGIGNALAEVSISAKPRLKHTGGDTTHMPEILASALHERPVLSTDGWELGTVYNLTMEQRTGKLDTLLVDPSGDGVERFDTTDDGYLRIPAEMIESLDDQLMVSFFIKAQNGQLFELSQ